MTNEKGWERLAAPYFGAATRHVFDEWFAARKVRLTREKPAGPVWYESEAGVIVEFTYYYEDSPRYAPLVNIGVMRDSVFLAAGLWAILPPGSPLSEYYHWTFSNAEQLEASLSRIRDEIMPVYVEPLLSQPEVVLAAAGKR